MSVEIWENLNDPKPEKTQYKIGTADFEYSDGSISKIVGDAIRSIYRGLRLPVNLLLGAIDGNGALCPTYGLWGGQGWSGGVRGSSIDWARRSKGVKSLHGSCWRRETLEETETSRYMVKVCTG